MIFHDKCHTMLPYVLPTRIMVPVLSMFKTNFVAVPDLSLVLPVTTSGPGSGAIRKSTLPESPIAEGDAQTTPIVTQPNRLAKARHPRTYGVRPELAIPMTLSSSGSRSRRCRSSSPACALSSAPSCAWRMAASPPAINPTNWECGAANVGGISDASRIPSLKIFVVGHRGVWHQRRGFPYLPLVPAPTYTTRPPRRTRGARASIAPAISGRQALTLSATRWSSELMTVHTSSVDMRSICIVRGFTPSVCSWAKLLKSIAATLDGDAGVLLNSPLLVQA